MKLITTILPLVYATFVSSSALFSNPSQDVFNPQWKVPGDNPLEFCQNPDGYIAHVDYVDLNPNPPLPGTKLVVTASGYFDEDIEEGAKVQLRVKYNKYITLINQVADLCENLPKIDIECPLKKGPMTIHKEVELPKLIPPGMYEVFAEVVTNDSRKITCMEATVHFSRQ